MKRFVKIFCVVLTLMWHLSGVIEAAAQETVCARVKVEIGQEFTFERQAFDARMKITNGLSTTPLEQINVEVLFTDEFGNTVSSTTEPIPPNPDPTQPSPTFYFRVETLTGIGDVSGTGVVAPESEAEIHWLIIPTYDAAGGSVLGKRYFVGARLTYVSAGVPGEIVVEPDFITVRPQPKLVLDYFLPIDVRGDDPFTTPVEPPVPFTLGLRIKNVGLAPSVSTRIESSEPEITENLQNLLISFQITGSYIDEEPVQPTLLLDFGEIAPAESKVGRWVMESSLSGQFVSFSATWSHLASLGGRLTSLVDGVYTHRLIRDVLVAVPGSDSSRDFLALEEGAQVPKLYESNGVDTPVTQQPITGFGIQGTSGGVVTHFVDIPVTSGPMYSKAPDIYGGTKVVTRVIRQSDQREISLRNVWFSVEGTGPTTGYHFNLFDVDGGGRYLVDVASPIPGAEAPVIQPIPGYLRIEGQSLNFTVTATDPNQTIPTLSVDSLPLGASFTDNGNGTGTFAWPSTLGQAGHYPVTFRATDGVLTTSITPTFRIAPLTDTDDDGMLDAWELSHFGDLSRDGTGDFDGDGLTDKEEFLMGTDPTFAGNAPSVPAIESPLNLKRVASLTPVLTVINSRHGVEVPKYDFELFEDGKYQHKISNQMNINEGVLQTVWTLTSPLQEDRWYYWRVRSKLVGGVSEWNYAKFFVSAQNSPPSAPGIVSPAYGEILDSRSPRLVVQNAVDPDGDELRYAFGVVGFVAGQPQLFYANDILPGDNGFTSWSPQIPANVPPPYIWTAWAYDPLQATTAAPLVPFGIDTTSPAPGAVLPLFPGYDQVVQGPTVDFKFKGRKPGASGTLTYQVQVDSDLGFSSPNLRQGSVTQVSSQVTVSLSGLEDNTTYFWRVRAVDGVKVGPWQLSKFNVDLKNDEPKLTGPMNPFDSGRVDSLQPVLKVFPAHDPEGDRLFYDWEVYEDGELQHFVVAGQSTEPSWKVSTPLGNFRRYFWRYKARDPQGRSSPWSEATKVFISHDQINDPPHIRATSPAATAQFTQDSSITIRWADLDEDTNAEVRFYLNNQLLNNTFSEDLDSDLGDSWKLPPLFSAPVGTYNLNVAIYDGVTEYRDNTCCNVTITPRSPTLDSDGDGRPDIIDNCPYSYNPGQADRGGFKASGPDGIGDACQCGDVDGNGRVNEEDLTTLNLALLPDTTAYLPFPERCNVAGQSVCDEEDKQALSSMLEDNLPVPQNCSAAQRG